ncbi:MAG: hypothetical protein Q8Q28_00645 [Pseudomonadota bacterium]|nr:hypothetical protein [Pseudomonadota bacterium]
MRHSILTLFLYLLATFPTGADTLVSREQRPVALVREDGTVWMEEKNGETSTGLVDTRVAELEEIIFVSAGARHLLALDKTGRVWAWGDNQAGQLGDGGTRASAIPRQVASLRGIVGIAAGDWHSLAVDGTGQVWAWGSDSLGQLGSGQAGAFRYSTTPIQVSGLPPLRALAAGTAHSLGLASDGTVWSWGAAQDPAGSRRYKAQVPELSGIAEIHARGDASYARGESGQEWGWGRLSDKRDAALPVALPTGSFADARKSTQQAVTTLNGRVGDPKQGYAQAMIAADGRPCGKSDAAGAYLCVVPRGWRGTLTASLSGHRFSSRKIDRAPTRLDFTPLPESHTITRLVRDVANKTGIRPASGAARPPAARAQAEKAGETPALQRPLTQVGKAGEAPALQKPPAARAQAEVLSSAGVSPALPRAPAEVKDAGATSPAAVAVPEATAPLTLEGTISLTGGLFGQAHGLAGVRIVGRGANCATTDAQGRFTCQVAAGWSGHLAPMKRHYRFSPGSFTYRQLHTDMTQQDFAASYEPE